MSRQDECYSHIALLRGHKAGVGRATQSWVAGKAEKQKLARCSSSSGYTRNTRKWKDNLEVEGRIQKRL